MKQATNEVSEDLHTSSVGSGTFFEINITIKVVNGKIKYFVKGHRVKPNGYYKFRSDFVARKNV